MSRPLRYVPPDSLVEVTCRTVHGRFLLRPSRDLRDVTLGILARAADRYSVGICYFVYLSNHAHLLLLPADAKELAGFMRYVNGNLAKEAGRLHYWRERLWGRRYDSAIVSDEPDKQVERLRYLLEQGCKEGLVRKPQEWPGATGIDALLSAKPLSGLWFDRTAEYKARRCGKTPAKYEFAESESFLLMPLPAWRKLSAEERKEQALDLVRGIELETRQRLTDTGRAPLGSRRVQKLDPHRMPSQPKKRSPAPRFHARHPHVRRGLEFGYLVFRTAYRQAADALKAGARGVEFPAGSFPPGLPFARGRPPLALA